MVVTPLLLARFLVYLADLDEAYAREWARKGCPHCGRRLYAAHFLRKYWGWPLVDGKPPDRRLRRRWCYACHACEERFLVDSLRFLGRRFYVAPCVLGLPAQQTGAPVRLEGCDEPCRRTLAAWREWWRTRFVASRVWTGLRARFAAGCPTESLPGRLLGDLAGTVFGVVRQVVGLLRALGPLTGTSQAM